MWIGTVERCRQIDRLATTEYSIPTRVLMERAGLAVFGAVSELLPKGGQLAVLCGHGNNGGDGFVVARLAQEQGYCVDCLVSATQDQLSPDAREQMQIATSAGVEPLFSDDPRWEGRLSCLGKRDLVVDALLGTGAKCEVRGSVREAIAAVNRSGAPVVSVDVPSGIDATSGEELGESIWALRTVTFGLPKPFLFQGIGVEHAGYWTVADIGLPHALLSEPSEAFLIENEWVADLLPERMRCSHKGENGSVLIVAGCRHMPGAATMAAKAALRSGAGLVTVAAVPSVCDAVAHHLPEVLFLPLPETNGALNRAAADVILEAQHRYHSAVIGPGLSQADTVLEFLSAVFESIELPAVVDADALNAVSQGVSLPKGDCVLTPHPGEMGRLMQSSIAEIQADRFHAVQSAISRYGHAILLKGPYTIIGEPNQPMIVNQSGNPGMASGGMGDVLSGVIGTLLAEHIPAYYAGACGMYWHGYAGDLAAEAIGSIGYTAMELADRLPSARAKITELCDGC